MGLFSCFGLRTRSYNAKKYELTDNNKENKKKNRRSTDMIGVADTNVYPQMIEETGGEVRALKDIKDDMDDSQCHINNNHNSDHKDDKKPIKEDIVEEKVCDDCAEKDQTEEHHKVTDHKDVDTDNHSAADHKSHETSDLSSAKNDSDGHHEQTTADHNTSVPEVSHFSTSDHNAVSMDTTTTSDFSGGADTSGGDSGGGDCGGGDCGGGD